MIGLVNLVLFGSKKYAIFDRIRYLISQKSSIRYVISHNYAGIKTDSYDALPLEKAVTLRNFLIPIKSVFNKDQNDHYYNMFLEKCLDQLAEK